ncbi:hypothetical protein [Promicromonospora iranensis]|uniref:hypothetical protein n=1 Tax=Promicromonospora iranensis TaxID=1105144 RepID=UPI0023A93EF5|nr:hypothetical protein [Promicromonospora iranensis]
MNSSHGTPDDDFVARVRQSAHAAVPASTLDLDSVLRSSRRKHATRRAGVTLASTLALATVGAGAAGALPGIPGFWSSAPVEVETTDAPPSTLEGEVDVDRPVPSPTDIPSPDPEAELAYLAPGVRTVAEPATYRVDRDTVVLDLGLDAGGGDRYLAVVTLAKIDGRHSATDLEVLAGGDTALENLRAGNLGGTLLWRGVTSDAMVLPADGGPALVFGFSSGAAEGDQHLVFDDPLTGGAAGAQGAPASPEPGDGEGSGAPEAGASLRVTPFDVLGDGSVWMRVLQVDRSTAEPRGFLYSNQDTWSASWCRTTSPECAVIHDVAGESVDRPKAAAPAPMVAELTPMLIEDAEANEVPAMETCVAQRTGSDWTAPPQLTGKSFWQAPKGVDADVWRLCLIDLSEALQVASTSEAPPPPGDVTPSPAPSKEPTQAPEDEDPLGLGELLDGLFGG